MVFPSASFTEAISLPPPTSLTSCCTCAPASRSAVTLALMSSTSPDVVLRADRAAVNAGATGEVRGATAVAGTFSGRARFAQPVLIDGAVGAVWAPGGRPRVVFGFTIIRGKITEIHLVADAERLRQLDLAVLND